ncbi:hypothetical protein GPECTOR_360g130 [Gonium pectorale]|uniref:SNARE-complex protein Syntaxin-18 N-terminal domain-containing protein n=1 Tax=Gonium pectorale TaxID=33097 RepID=A0A150FVK5_GONPE|nr:hypothetical protein GPECTOR_360g130 [Gonium pectorale]|eukprot:KXZ41617.1 hypothetical protein GPECTOR_360g130 [Gonium pectorale]
MDRTHDLIKSAERFLETASLPPDDSIGTLWASIRGMQQEYAREAAEAAAKGGAAAAASWRGGGGDRVNEHTAAHMHGVVLILAEKLHRATRAFDRLRAGRYQALVEHRPPGATVPAAGLGPGPHPSAASSSRDGGGSPWAAPGRQANGNSSGNCNGNGGGPISTARAAALAAARSGWQHLIGVSSSGPKGHEHDPDRQLPGAQAAAAGGAGGAGGGGWPVQVQEVETENRALLERLTATRNAAVGVERAVRDVAALNQMFSSAVLAQPIHPPVHPPARPPAGAPETKAETIEGIYMAAVEATHNITAGNESLRKTVDVNRSTTRYVLVLLLVATLSLLFFDWFNS